ncbi:MAG TPA: hypothetical protein VH143_22915 [Kofleriaceae bacterium]|nr:hypothetical protein [Kofleriaceae bacterium]
MRRVVLILLAMASAAFAEPPHHGEHEILYNRPSGFWTSNAPAIGGAYKYNLMYVGLGVLAITGFFTYRLLRRARSV